jgi:hypothetical protein
MEQGLIFSRSGARQRLYRVSPLLFSQYQTENFRFLPRVRDLPEHGLVTRFYVFDFGYSNPSSQIAPYNTAYCPLQLGRDFLAHTVTATYESVGPQVLTAPPAALISATAPNVSPGFLVNFLHTHNGVQRQWSNKSITDQESTGDGMTPLILRDPALLPQGDTITCMIQNLANVTLAAQIVFMGGEFDTDSYPQEKAS